MFQGEPSSAVTVFASHGFPCPPLTNPADHLMDVISCSPHVHATARAASFVLQEPPVIE